MKKMARILALLLIVVMALSLVGCAKARLKGEWVNKDGYGFKFDGKEMSMIYDGDEGEGVEYKVKGNKIIVEDEETEFKFKGGKLILNPGEDDEVTLERKK